MKKKILSLFLLIGLLVSGCGRFHISSQQPGSSAIPIQPATSTSVIQSSPQPAGSSVVEPPVDEPPIVDPPADESPIVEPPVDEPPIADPPVREYGESKSYQQIKDNLTVRILYPTGQMEQLDRAVEQWVLGAADTYQNGDSGSNKAQLTLDYSSYLVKETLVAVKLSGTYERQQVSAEDVSVCFNADMESGELLALGDVLVPGGEAVLRDMVIRQAGLSQERTDEKLLNNWLLTPDGLEITLRRGEYLPEGEGTKVLLFPYEELKEIFRMPDKSSADQPQDGEGEDDEPDVPILDPNRPVLALTFDDGPSKYSEELLDILAVHGGKVTFFVVGNMVGSRPKVVQRIAAEGHEIGSHTWDHQWLTKLTEDEIRVEFTKARDKIREVAGVDAIFVRPPYGAYNAQVKAIAAEQGISLVNWSVDTLDWMYKDTEKVYESVMSQAKDGAIILCHDLHQTTVKAMERAIPDLIAQGYQLVTVSQLLTRNGEKIIPGGVYNSN